MSVEIPTVSVVVIDNGRVLLVRHGEATEHVTGVYGLPGGRIEEGESLVAAAVRELQEEAGLLAREEDLVQLPTEYHATLQRKAGPENFWLVVFLVKRYQGEIILNDDTTAEWVPLDMLTSYTLLGDTEAIIQEAVKMNSSL